MIGALARVCNIDLKLCNGKYAKAAQRLVKAGYSPGQIVEIYGEDGDWYRYDWRGKRGDPPNVGSINETIQRAVSGAWKVITGADFKANSPPRQDLLDVIQQGIEMNRARRARSVADG